VPKWGDVQTLTGAEILRHCQTPDVIIWGSPCQDLSVAGKRAGLDGERSGLFHEGIRIINELREATDGRYPRVSVWENVAGALNSNRGADFGTVLNEMAEAGALVIEWALLDAQHFGVPQRRRRVFVVAIFDPATAERCPDPLLPVAEGLRGDSAKGKQKGQAVAGTLGGGSGSSGWSPDTERMTFVPVDEQPSEPYRMQAFGVYADDDTASAIKARDHKDATDLVVEPFVMSARAQTATDSETWKPSQVNPTLNQFDMGDTRATTAVVQYDGYNQKVHTDDISVTLRIGRDSSDFIAQPIGFSHTQGLDAQPSEQAWPTLRAKDGTAVLAPTITASNDPSRSPQSSEITQQVEAVHAATMAVRRLTPLECERLMGWPDNWTDGQADSHRYRQCGNGVATPVAYWIAKHLHNLMGDN